MFAGIHAQQSDVASHGFEFLTEVTYSNGFTIFQRIRKLFAEEQYLHTSSRLADHKSSLFMGAQEGIGSSKQVPFG